MFGQSNQIKRNQYAVARGNLLLIVIFTLINVVLCLLSTDTYFLFSAIVPYFIALVGAEWCGLYPEEYYAEMGITEADLWPTGFIAVFATIAVVIIALYFICWLLSKKHVAFMIAALVLFVIDSVAMFVLFVPGVDMIVDYIFHVWVLVSLTIGIIHYFRNGGVA